MKDDNLENKEKRTSYDDVPYESHAFAQSHPDRLATIGRLFNMTPAPVNRCRVLELGAASGGNLIPMAFYLPESEFVGIDQSGDQARAGQNIIRDLGLKNIRLEHADIMDVDTSWGMFDYILCHGVYSWVPDIVRDKIMIIASANLAPQGIAYISYNTYPGWHLHETFRYAMLYHTKSIREPWERVRRAKELIDVMIRHIPVENDPYALHIRKDMEVIRSSSDSSVFHEHLEEVNTPVYFHRFAEHADRHNLQYMGESDFGDMLTHNFPEETANDLSRICEDVIHLEQYMDFLRHRPFRRTLLCHKAVKADRNIAPERLKGMMIASNLMTESGQVNLSPDVQQTFCTPKGKSIRVRHPLTKMALAILRAQWPKAVVFEELFQETIRRIGNSQVHETLAAELSEFYKSGAIELHSWQGNFSTYISERPKINDLALYQSRAGLPIVNPRHETIDVDDFSKQVLLLSDGTRTRKQLSELLSKLMTDRNLLEKSIDRILSRVSETALLSG